jgi:O-antigen/teichoic acid export membrane protein
LKALVDKIWEYRHGAWARSLDMAVVVGGIGLARILAFVTAVLVARFAGAATFGEYSLFTTVFVLVSEMPAALDTAYIRNAGSSSDKSTESEHLVVLLLAKTIFMLVFCFIGFLSADFIAKYFLKKEQAASIVHYGITSGAIYCISTTFISLYQRRRNFFIMSLLRVIPNMFVVLFIVLAVYIRGNITQKLIGIIYLSVALFFALGTAILLSNKISSYYRISVRRMPEFYKIGGTLVASNALVNFTSRLDVFYLTPFLAFHELGIYGAAVRYSVIAGIITATITTIMLPKAPFAINDRNRFDKYILEAGGYILLQSVLVVMLIAFMDPIIKLIFGKVYLAMKTLAVFLLVQVLVVAIGVPFQSLLQCGKNVKIVLYLSVARLLVAIGLLYVMVPAYGATGGAAAMVGAAGVHTTFMFYLGMKYYRPSKMITCLASVEPKNV